jgi:hypothetical protein
MTTAAASQAAPARPIAAVVTAIETIHLIRR